MGNTYTQIHLHLIFAVKFRISLINKAWKDRLHQYMTGIFQNNNHKMLQINSMPDHIHSLIGMRPHQDIASLMQNVKTESTKWINKNRLSLGRFAWQEGYGAFTVSKSQVPNVIRYIQNQEAHHKKESFLDEFRRILIENDIEFDEKSIFKEPE